MEFHADACVLDARYADPEMWRRAAEVLFREELQATVHLPYRWTDLAALDHSVWEGSLQSCLTALRATAPLRPRLLAVHPTNYVTQAYVGRASPDQRGLLLEPLAERLCRGLRHLGEEGGPALALENLEGVPLDLFRQVVEEAGVGVCLDLGHLVSDGEDPARAVAVLGPRLVGLHLHDALPPPARRAHLPLGAGRLDLEGTASALRAAGFSGPVVLEVDGDEEVYADTTSRFLKAVTS